MLPDAITLCLDACSVDDTARQITLVVHSTQARALCPLCTTPTRRIHSHYERTLADLPWAQYRVRQAQGLPPRRQGRRQTLPVVAEPTSQPLTPRRATWLVLRREARRTPAEAQQLAQLHAQSAEVAEAIDLAQDFATLVRQRQPTQLDPWLTRATTSALEALQRFASGLRDDYEAVKAGVTLPWSSGPVEGHINRLNMLKRQMCGRARLDLLSHRFVLAPRARPAQAAGPRAPSQAHTDAEAA